jgi:hypothetical protein
MLVTNRHVWDHAFGVYILVYLVKEILLNMGLKYWKSTFNAQASKVIILVV